MGLSPADAEAASRRRAVLLLTLVLAGAALLLLSAAPTGAPWDAQAALVALALLACFAVAERVVLDIDVGDSAHSMSLVEVPLVLSLFWLPPSLVVASRVLGALVALHFHRRQSPSKIAFNLAMMALEAATAVVVLSALGGTGAGLHDHLLPTWGATVVACLASAAVSSGAVLVVIAVATGEGAPAATVRGVFAHGLPSAAVGATLGVLASAALAVQPAALAPLLVAAGALGAAYAAHVRLRRRHTSLSALYGFVRSVSAADGAEGQLRAVLHQAQELLRSDVAVLSTLVAPLGGGTLRVVRHVLDADGRLRSSEADVTAADWPVSRCVSSGQSLLAPRGTADRAVAAYLRHEGLEDALLVALPGEHGVSGTLLVGGSRSEHSTYEPADLQALEGLAHHAAVALQNGHLLERLTHESRHDPLTGLPNRTEFQARLQAVLDDGGRAAVLFMDLDRFKDVNDTLGHDAGDRLLGVVAERLRRTLDPSAAVARLGGDEFAVVLPDHDAAAAVAVATRLKVLLEQPVRLDDLSVDVGLSIGISVTPEHGSETGVLMRRADVAMYDAKARDGIAVHDALRDEPSASRLALVAQLRDGLAADELVLHYQPQALAADGTTVRVEALLRWQHPQRGLVGPDDFLPVAERAGMLEDITRWVLRRSLDDLVQWRAAGTDLGVSVNLSPRNLLEPGLADVVRGELVARGLPAHVLTLEITEGTLMAEPERAVSTLQQLRDTGVRLSIDDFGTGYSSLAYLKTLPVDEVKVDKSFVKGLADDPADVAIVRAVVALADSLRLEVVAEGVEDAASLGLLQALGCRYLQGYHLSRPVPAAEVTAWLAGAAERSAGWPVRRGALAPAPRLPRSRTSA